MENILNVITGKIYQNKIHKIKVHKVQKYFKYPNYRHAQALLLYKFIISYYYIIIANQYNNIIRLGYI